MKFKRRPLNKGETFCCSVKRCKELFAETAAFLDFAYLSRTNITFKETADSYYIKKHIKGQIVFEMLMRPRDAEAILSFYAIKENRYSEELKKEFDDVYLPMIYKKYQEQLLNEDVSSKRKIIIIELTDISSLVFYEDYIIYR